MREEETEGAAGINTPSGLLGFLWTFFPELFLISGYRIVSFSARPQPPDRGRLSPTDEQRSQDGILREVDSCTILVHQVVSRSSRNFYFFPQVASRGTLEAFTWECNSFCFYTLCFNVIVLCAAKKICRCTGLEVFMLNRKSEAWKRNQPNHRNTTKNTMYKVTGRNCQRNFPSVSESQASPPSYSGQSSSNTNGLNSI